MQSNLGASLTMPTGPTSPPSKPTVRPATRDDASDIAALGSRVFSETFGHTCSPQDMDNYLSSNFTTEVIAQQLQDPAKTVLVACVESKLAAFLVLTKGTSETCVEHIPESERIEVQRIYANPDVQGRGVATQLFSHALNLCRHLKYRFVWLGVWENNVRATRFYQKFGFSKIGQHDFWLGGECQTDYIFICQV